MARQSYEDRLAAATEELSEVALYAVAETLAQRSVEPSRSFVGILTDSESSERERLTDLTFTMILVRWLTVAREQLPADDDVVDPVLAWIKENLGTRFAARARYTAGPLRGADSATDMFGYRAALGADFLPSLAWQLAAVVALYGDGDMAWLRKLVGH